jgi:transglutaminase-like putative cysteine protease
MVRFILLLISLYFMSNAIGSNEDLIAFMIPESMKRNANAVIRNSESVLNVFSESKAEYHIKTKVTILNEKGDQYGIFIEPYNNQSKITNISIQIYDASGNHIKRVKSSEINDFSAFSDYTLYSDSRLKYFEPQIKKYPYTVEMEYTVQYSGYIHFPQWWPQPAPDVSVESSTLKVSSSGENQVRFYQRNLPGVHEACTSGTISDSIWTVNDIPAFKTESFQPPFAEIVPNVFLAPIAFNYDGGQGSFESWTVFGKWIEGLIKGKDILPEETVSEMKELVAGSADSIEMVNRIYKYLQDHTRYVSIQLGIGGYQPFDAATVDRVGYGDCKALTNYMMALLKSVGITSNYAVVKSGRNLSGIIENFPAQQFNHVILLVPFQNDSIWLECTSQTGPFGYLGEFCNDRKALVITTDGGKLTRTCSLDWADNYISSTYMVDVDETGNAMIGGNIDFSGLKYDFVSNFLRSDNESRKKWMIENFYLPDSRITGFDFTEYAHRVPSAEIVFDQQVNGFAQRTGKRLFIPLNRMNNWIGIPEKPDDRKLNVYIPFSIHFNDTLIYKLPSGYAIEHKPESVEFESNIGSYSYRFQNLENTIVCYRRLIIRKGSLPACEYADIYDFFQKIAKAEKSGLVLIRNEE